MKKTISYKDFPVTKETENLRTWENLDIDQKAHITINKDDKIYESRIYPFKQDNDKIKVISKINTITNKITFIITSNNIKTGQKTVTINQYHKLIQSLENEMQKHIIINKDNFLTGKQIYNQIKR